ncbi:MAG TPA: hybrid sensor histidine kinase/response regulator [Opitutus sp.]|nr:hybrid sensor histidine kinase/response regulator [Opitutus sp.]
MLPRIIIADDEPSFLTMTATVLGGQDYDLVLARNGSEALDAARRQAPDLMLMDVQMPGVDGVAACRELRADKRLAEVPVVLLTGLNDREARLRGFAAGADDFLGKPFDHDELRMRVRVIVRLNRFRRLQEQRQRTERVIALATDGYLLLRSDGTVAQANQAAWRLLGGIPDAGGTAPDFVALAARYYRCETPEAWHDGVWEEERKPRLLVSSESGGRPARWLRLEVLEPHAPVERWFRLRDVTREHALERDLWTFHGAISHKLRTPLHGLLGAIDLLSAELETAPNEIRELAAMARESAERLHESIDDILSFLSAAKRSAPPMPCSAGEAAAMARAAAARMGIKACTVAADGSMEGTFVTMPAAALNLCLEALLDNARKFHPRATPEVRIEIAAAPERWRLTVRDDGVHLPAEALEHAWEPYYQWEPRCTGEVPGMGLGLAMVSALVVEHGGSCRLRNRAGAPGIEAELLLPCTRPHRDGMASADAPERVSQKQA